MEKYVDEGGYLSDVIDGVRCKFKIPRQISNADIFKEMVFGGNNLPDFISYKNIWSVLMKMSFMEYV